MYNLKNLIKTIYEYNTSQKIRPFVVSEDACNGEKKWGVKEEERKLKVQK